MSVLSHLENTASGLVLSESEKSSIETSITTLRGRLSDYFGRDIQQQIRFGSSTRGTILPRKADSNSDIDYMIVFDNTYNLKPQSFISRLKTFAQSRYSSSEIHQSHPTVVLMLNHIKFDLVPAYINLFGTILIPGPKSGFTDWITTDPNGFNQRLSNKNNQCGNQIKPMIRLVKYWNARNDYVYNSYELEQSLVNNFYWGCSNLKDYFFIAVENLSTSGLPQYKIDKVQRAKDIVANVKTYESQGKVTEAETEVKKIIPELP